MRTSVQLGSAFITISCRKCKGYLTAFKDQLRNTCMMRVTLITDNDVVLLQLSELRRFKSSCENCKKLLHNTKCGMKWCFGWHKWWATMSIFHYLQGKRMMRRKIYTLQFLMSLMRPSFSANYSIHEMTRTPTKRNVPYRKHYLTLLASGFQND